jgi:serine phosphatase RsbU (regulator of sigma subunit)/anti-sigma regulatory factor (Ser/Thr protein kinase)
VLSREELRYIEALAGQAAQALDRASAFESEQTIAETLQRSVLPLSLPRVEGAQIAARYLPGTAELDVGGDWYDVIPQADGRVGLVVGDVVGKGVQAAATMAQLRNALRAFALDRMKPASTLARLNKLAEESLETTFATLVYAVVDPVRRVCRFASAGHPPPVVLRPDGSVELLEGGRSLPLGAGASARYVQDVVDFPVGAVLLLYSDGLVERRGRSIDEGLALLVDAARAGPRHPDQLVDHVVQELLGSSPLGDDVALLAFRLLAVAPHPLVLEMPNDLASLGTVRDSLRVWLEGAPAGGAEVHDLVLATWEACANAVEHAQSPSGRSFTVRAALEDSTVTVVVEDTGHWKVPDENTNRGLGLRLMESLVSRLEVEPGEDGTGTRVTLEQALEGR